MNRKPVLANVLLLCLLASVVTRAQEGAKKGGSDEVVRLYEQEGKALIDSLEKNYYGRDTAKALTLRGSVYLFSPTDPKDHLATPFQHLPARSVGKARVARVSLLFSGPEPSGSNLVVLVQRDGFGVLQELRPHPDSAAALSSSQDVPIPPSAAALRLLFMSPELKPTNLPNRVEVECLYSVVEESAAGERWALYILVAAIGIAGVVVIFCRMRKAKPA